MLWFWGLTLVERGAYIPSVGRVPEKTRKASKRPRRDGRIGVTRPWLEAHRPSTRSYRHDHSYRQLGAPDAAQTAVDGKFSRGERSEGRRQTGGRSARGCENSMRPPLRAVPLPSDSEYFGVSGAPKPPRNHVEAAPPRRCQQTRRCQQR